MKERYQSDLGTKMNQHQPISDPIKCSQKRMSHSINQQNTINPNPLAQNPRPGRSDAAHANPGLAGRLRQEQTKRTRKLKRTAANTDTEVPSGVRGRLSGNTYS